MKRNRMFMTLTMVGLLAAGSGAVYAFGGGCDGGGRRGHEGFGPLGAAYRVDNLTQEQRAKLDTLRDKQREQMEQMRADRLAAREAVDKAADAAALRPLAEKQGKLVTEMIMKQAELRAEVQKILTAEQRAQLQEMQKDRNERRGEREYGPRW